MPPVSAVAIRCVTDLPRTARAGLYLLSECLRLSDRPVVIRGDGVGVTRLIWTANAASSGDAWLHDYCACRRPCCYLVAPEQ